MKKKLHIISHSHWDREWYMGFEQHRARLVELIDALIDKMENEPEYRYFHLDGHTVLIEDYLELRPEKRERLNKLIKEGRIQIGPWYVLQDEFLTSGEANLRNMLEGMRCCREYGAEPLMVGYFPDAFGNISQVPQILRGFGIDNAVFGRGMGVIMEDNKPTGSSSKKELNWYAPDGSCVIGVMFSDWYNNAWELPTDREEARRVYRELIDKTSKNASTPHLLGMNGCDHQPLQQDLLESVAVAKELFGDEVEIIHSNFKDYIECIRPYREQFPAICGEITGQYTNGSVRLVDTATTHMPLKLYNHKVQNMLQQQSEPIGVMADMAGDGYRDHLLRYAWKTLMKNHPHDSICTCSCDTVAREMAVRFEKAYQAAEYARDEAAAYLANSLDTENGAEQNIVVFHTNPKRTEGEVTATVRLEEYADPDELSVTDFNNIPVGCVIRYLGKKFSYTLPKDSFRKVHHLHTYEIRFPVCLEGVGCFVYKLQRTNAKTAANDLVLTENGAENSFLKFRICGDGSIELWDKTSGRHFEGLHRFEDSGDCGDGYNYFQTKDNSVVYAEGSTCQLTEHTPYSATYTVRYYINIPAGLTEDKMRSKEIIRHEICSKITLRAASRRLDVETSFANKSENHRLRVLFPNDIQTQTVMADGQFDVVERDITPWKGWENPSNTQRMQAFFGLEDPASGVLVAVKGLCSYEILRDGKNTMALDLLRAVGEIGDWGDFPAPMMQVKGEHVLNYAIIPYAPQDKAAAFESAYGFAQDRFCAVQTGRHGGKLA
ncbi:MAG: alpha-mannosidase, partial [Oscillospiraceae bacterium]|nr:alpha-mannosidase [Oscillospiraceae bacterium]